jgi:hypothetical protein
MFPLMLYRDGVKLDDYVIVNDEAEQAAQEADGYARLDMAAVKGWARPAEPVAVQAEQPAPVEPVKRGPGRPKKVAA